MKMESADTPIDGAVRKHYGGLVIDTGTIGVARVQRIVYPPGWTWATSVKPLVGTETCLHGHGGYLASGRLSGQMRDGTSFDYRAPAFVTIEPGHDVWTGDEEGAVLIQFDFAENTNERLGFRPASPS